MTYVNQEDRGLDGVAIIGVAGRFPGAADADELWRNLCNGVESIRFFDDQEVIDAGIDPSLVSHPEFVKAWGTIEGVTDFDAGYFGIPGREAEAMDPQHRLIMEFCVTALEDAGYNPDSYAGPIGLITGVGISTYLMRHVLPHTDKLQSLGEYLVFLGNDKDFVATRTAYKLNLRGPAFSVSTACSTTLVATHLAVQQLLTYQSDICLAGGCNIKLPQESGYLYRKGQLKSPDGRCRPFDAKARGTVFGNGGGIVVLKRCAEAVADGDHIYAVIKGSAINNDGSSKAGYTAPSVSGQAACIAEAHAMAGFEAETIGHIEAHGTATELGDPVEVKALKQVFGNTRKRNYMAMTSVKSNIGHLDSAAGIAGLIKLALSFEHRKIPPSLNFEEPNPEIDFADSPFFVNTQLRDWLPAEPGVPLRACQSSFGAGGTNVHLVLEAAPPTDATTSPRDYLLLTLSAKTATALERLTKNLLERLETLENERFADAVYTLNIGRRNLEHRRFCVARNRDEALRWLSENDPRRVFSGLATAGTAEQRLQAGDLMPGLKRTDGEALEQKLTELGQLWLRGAELDWTVFYQNEKRRRVRMPTYPFDSRRYWLERPKGAMSFAEKMVNHKGGPENEAVTHKKLAKSPLENMFYLPSWKRAPLVSRTPSKTIELAVIFADDHGLGQALATHLLGQGREVVVVKRGDDFEVLSEQQMVIDYRDPNHYNGLFTDLYGRGKTPSHVFYLWGLDSDPEALGSGENFKRAYLYPSFVVQGLDAQVYEKGVKIVAVTHQCVDVIEGDVVLPEQAALLGLLRVIPQEHGKLAMRVVDIAVPESAATMENLAGQLCEELDPAAEGDLVAYRAGRRWVQDFQPLALPEVDEAAWIKPGGVYLITGGFGGLGLALARHLAKRVGAKLILTSRGRLPERDHWPALLAEENHPAVARIRAVMELTELGGQVYAATADVTDEKALAEAIGQGEARFGPLEGVFHTAGVADASAIKRGNEDTVRRTVAAKIDGTRALDRVLAGKPLRFLVLYSSLASVLGGVGQAAYAAGNAFLDAFAISRQNRREPFVVAVNWDSWRESGMAAGRKGWLEGKLDLYGLSDEEGVAALMRILAAGQPQVIVSAYDLFHRYQVKNAIALEAKQGADTLDGKNLYPRPEMSVPFRQVASGLEQRVARLWQEHLGIGDLGADDDFFELGGDSLKGMNLINHLEKDLGEVVHVDALFDASTIGLLARYIKEHYPQAAARLLGDDAPTDDTTADASGSTDNPSAIAAANKPIEVVTEERFQQFEGLVPKLSARSGSAGPKNKTAAFILAPPRSGSTLLRVILAGNPALFAPPELFLLNHNTMADRAAAFKGKDSYWLEGLIVALMHIKTTDANHAASYVVEALERNDTTQSFYAALQNWVGERLLVDKTPPYAYDINTLQRAEQNFQDARYIHLQRHPYAMIHSYNKAKMDLLLRRFVEGALPFSAREVGELVYLLCHRNILKFFEEIPPERRYQLRFEDLLAEPEQEVSRLCDFLGVPYVPDMLNTHKEVYRRMTEGTRTGFQMIGDIKFHGFKGIEPGVAGAWRDSHGEDFLGDQTKELAALFGYQTEISPKEPTPLNQLNPEDVDHMSDERIEELLHQMGQA